MRKTLALAGLGLMVLLVLGCESTSSGRGAQRGMVVADNLVIPDLPVPRGFKIDNKRSYFNVNPTTNTRVVFVTYTGRGDALALMGFFRENMAVSGWDLKEEAGDFGAYVQKYAKAKEAVEVRIEPGRFKTSFSISLNPKGR